MNKFKNYLIAIVTIGLVGELYFYPFQGDFRFSAGVLALNLVLLFYFDIKEISLGIFTGLFILFLRSLIQIFSSDQLLLKILIDGFPAALYYLMYCILIYLFRLRKNLDKAGLSVFILFIVDIGCNILESLIRDSLDIELFKYIILIALIRSTLSYAIFIIFKNKEILILKKEHQKRYVELNSIISNIQSELFYLSKSTKDIESVMSKSYNLYENNKDNKDISNPALDIAREIHEIKKDYYRVIRGLESFMDDFEDDTMALKDISSIISDNISRYLLQENKDISFAIDFKDNFRIKNFYLIFTILNNLIINSIDASGEKEFIKVTQSLDDENLVLVVEDNGEGIEADNLPFIFNPGFTTKFDPISGEASTGIGLSHIKNIIETLNGRIFVDSNKGLGAKFTIILPLRSITN